MTIQQPVVRDERTVAFENASYKWAWSFLAFSLLIDGVYRGIARHEAAWDLLALVIVSSAIGTVYQARRRILGPSWVWKGILIAGIAGILSAITVYILTITRAM